MKSYEELLEYQATLSPTREYFLIMQRPAGSFTWTFEKMACDEKTANQTAIDIAMEGTCTRIIKCELPRMPDVNPHAVLADGDTQFCVTPREIGRIE